MKDGIYVARIERVNICSNGISAIGNWMFFEIIIAIRCARKRNVFKLRRDSWELEETFPDFRKENIKGLKDWRLLEGKNVLVSFQEELAYTPFGTDKKLISICMLMFK